MEIKVSLFTAIDVRYENYLHIEMHTPTQNSLLYKIDLL